MSLLQRIINRIFNNNNNKQEKNIINKYSFAEQFDIKNIIYSYLYDQKDVINLYNLNKNHQNNIKITNLYDIQEKYIKI